MAERSRLCENMRTVSIVTRKADRLYASKIKLDQRNDINEDGDMIHGPVSMLFRYSKRIFSRPEFHCSCFLALSMSIR